MNIFKKLIRPIADALDPTPGDLISGVLFGRVSETTGENPDVVESIINAYKKDPEIVRIRVEGQKAMAELELRSQEVASGVVTSLDNRSAQDPKIVQILRGTVRPGSVLVSVGTLIFIVLVTFTFGVVFSAINWTADKIAVLEVLIKVLMWIVGSLGLGYIGLRGSEKIVSIIKKG